MFDYHLHTSLSYDAAEPAAAMVAAAKLAGLTEICLTDHIDYSREIPHETISFSAEEHRAVFDALPEEGILLRRGAELGLTVWNKAEIRADAAALPYDFLLGSIHHIDELDMYEPPFWADKTREQAERLYLETMLACVEIHDDFDVLAHMTFLSKCRSNPYGRLLDLDTYRPVIERIMTVLIRKEKGMEINTSGVDRGLGFLPDASYLQLFHDLGGRIVTMGSDAHTIERVGQYIPEAAEVLREIFGHVCTFEGHRPIFHKL